MGCQAHKRIGGIKCIIPQFIVSDGRAAGVRLESGEETKAAIVVSNADPKSTFTRLIDERSLPNGFQGFSDAVQGLSTLSASLKLHATFRQLPYFPGTCVPATPKP